MATYNNIWKHRWAIAKRLAWKKYYRLLGNANASKQPLSLYSIKPGYRHATTVESYDATHTKDEWQKEVYQYAAQWMEQQQLQSIIDLGCGSGYKTVHYLGQYQTTGVEVDPTYSWLTKTYPDKKWLLFDNLKPSELSCDLIVCSDVIEHIEHPDDLLDFVAEMNFKQVIFSTPDRDRLCGTKDFGPPENTCHYREWNHIEFKNYLRGWFDIIDTQLINDKSNTQLVICQKHKKTNT